MSHGRFSPDGLEYHITDPHTPRPWHQYLVNDEYLANITQHGTGASHWQPLGEGLRTNLTEDRDGGGGPRLVYLKDMQSGEFWGVGGAPDFGPRDRWLCRVGLGYQTIESRRDGLDAVWTTCVPQSRDGESDSCELWTIQITNHDSRPRRVALFPYVEMHLTGGSTLMDFIAVLGGRFDSEANAIFGINSCVKFPPKFKAVFASDRPTSGVTVSRDEFLGHYRGYERPLAVEKGDVHNPEAGTEWLGASFRHEWTLAPGQTETANLLLGVIDSEDDGRRLVKKYLARGEPARVLEAIREDTARRVDRLKVQTPDEQFNRWMNIWLKHQLHFVARWGRVIGRGYRDVLQDTFAHRLIDPDRARQCLTEVFSKQFPSGRCIRAWRLPNAQLDLQHYADSPSWMIMALSMYLKETADWPLLDELVPFLNEEDPYAASTAEASVFDHVVLAQRYLLGDRGLHGLSHIHYGDWCDTMNGVGRRGKGVSVMLSMQVKWGCDQLAELAAYLAGKGILPAGWSAAQLEGLAREMQDASRELAQAINTHAWDGDWYIRAFDDDGVAVGSANGPASDGGELRIFLNSQNWALIADIAPPDRAEKALAAVSQHLDTGYGMVLSYPQSTFLKPRIGQMSAMTPGFYENGSVYTHGNCFYIAALAMAGRGDEAWEAFKTVLPDTPNKPNTDTEPYVIPNMYIGPVVERRMQRNLYLSGWRTGSAAWLYLTGVEWILGLRAEYDGLRIDPKLPGTWDKVKVQRPFRGSVYDVTIRRDDSVAPGTMRILLDGRPVEGVLPPPEVGTTYAVEVSIPARNQEH
ncbi:MAG: hypothetical protein JJU36_06355 [Phycisphaeraceae bacterium]|nr:hypothetical protein [Phycisphaeraceae bacterium]